SEFHFLDSAARWCRILLPEWRDSTARPNDSVGEAQYRASGVHPVVRGSLLFPAQRFHAITPAQHRLPSVCRGESTPSCRSRFAPRAVLEPCRSGPLLEAWKSRSEQIFPPAYSSLDSYRGARSKAINMSASHYACCSKL